MSRKNWANLVKGDLVEDLVALLHKDEGECIQTRIKIPPDADPVEQREIDVLLTTRLAGIPLRVAFECKNYADPIGVDLIEAFGGKLDDVGIPPQHGVFVAASGYTGPAQRRAAKLGMRLLEIQGLTADRMAAEIHDVYQSVVYLVAEISRLTVTSEAPNASPPDLVFLKDAAGAFVGGVPDLIWAKWRDGHISTDLGNHRVTLTPPPAWRWLFDGMSFPTSAEAVVTVRGIVVTDKGQGRRLSLHNALNGEVERWHIDGTWDPSLSPALVKVISTEDEILAVVPHEGIAHIQRGRIRMPRIVFNGNMLWPPSDRVLNRMRTRMLALARQGIWDDDALRTMSFAEMEGDILHAMWEPIMANHPLARDSRWPWIGPRKRFRQGKTTARPSRQRPRSITKGLQ